MFFNFLINKLRFVFSKYLELKKSIRRSKTPIDVYLLKGYPLERDFGSKRGQPLDRYYIDLFINQKKDLIKGRVLEIGDDRYSKRFISAPQRNVLRGRKNRGYKNYNGDLLNFATLKDIGQFDTLIITNVLNFIFDYDEAIKNIAKLTSKGGKCLFTVSAFSGISKFDNDRWGDYWKFSQKSLGQILKKYFSNIEIDSFGNASVSASFVLGLVTEDIPNTTLEIKDKNYPIIITALVSDPKKI